LSEHNRTSETKQPDRLAGEDQARISQILGSQMSPLAGAGYGQFGVVPLLSKYIEAKNKEDQP
jgi:hypothetical protein